MLTGSMSHYARNTYSSCIEVSFGKVEELTYHDYLRTYVVILYLIPSGVRDSISIWEYHIGILYNLLKNSQTEVIKECLITKSTSSY